MLYETPPRTLPCVCIVGHALDPTGSIWCHALTAEDRNRPPADGAGRMPALGGSWPRPERKPSAYAMSALAKRSWPIEEHFLLAFRSDALPETALPLEAAALVKTVLSKMLGLPAMWDDRPSGDAAFGHHALARHIGDPPRHSSPPQPQEQQSRPEWIGA